MEAAMAIDTRAPRSRRALLAAGLGGLGATVLQAIGRPRPAAAAAGDPLVLGSSSNTTDQATTTAYTGADLTGFTFTGAAAEGTVIGVNTGLGAGAVGTATSGGTGVAAYSNGGWGLFAQSAASGSAGAVVRSLGNSTAIIGVSTNGIALDLPAAAAKIGVYGYANQDANARAVYGKSLLGTGVWGNSDTGRGLFGRSTAGTGVSAQSDTGRAVYGTTAALDKTAVLGQNTTGGSTGVQGYAGGGNPPVPDGQTGVQGNSNMSTAANGVLGRSTIGTGAWGDTTDGLGVAGTGSGSGSVGVYASGGAGLYATGGVALVADGPALFTTSGKKTITSGSSTSVTVPGGLVSASIGLAVLQTNKTGVWVRAVALNTTNSTMTIYLNTSVSSATTIGWFVIN
jgi:hypothetical protein